jgi:uncharacterized protein
MKIRIHIFLSFITLFFAQAVCADNAAIPEPPVPAKLVNNYSSTGFLNSSEEQILEQKLQAFANETSNQIVIVIIDDLGGMEPWQFATELGNKWGVGQKDFNNGIVILIKPSGGPGERKFFIAVGKGLEGAIPDATCKQIENSELKPNLKAGNHFEALDKTTTVLMALAKGEYNSDAYGAKHANKPDKATLIVLLIVGIIFLVLMIKRGGGGGDGRMSFGPGFFIFPMGGGRSSGGGFSSGGFGGFGGGGFGGGGSGGNW